MNDLVRSDIPYSDNFKPDRYKANPNINFRVSMGIDESAGIYPKRKTKVSS